MSLEEKISYDIKWLHKFAEDSQIPFRAVSRLYAGYIGLKIADYEEIHKKPIHRLIKEKDAECYKYTLSLMSQEAKRLVERTYTIKPVEAFYERK